ncbi:MAG TPA: hypothetical protein VJY34_25685, partial [Roseiarcus sp.]|nr:hypothetical protein [Roseiarcus sp.]
DRAFTTKDTKSEQTKAPDEGIQFPASSASLRNEVSSYFQPAAQLHESVANSTCVNSVGPSLGRGFSSCGPRPASIGPEHEQKEGRLSPSLFGFQDPIGVQNL